MPNSPPWQPHIVSEDGRRSTRPDVHTGGTVDRNPGNISEYSHGSVYSGRGIYTQHLGTSHGSMLSATPVRSWKTGAEFLRRSLSWVDVAMLSSLHFFAVALVIFSSRIESTNPGSTTSEPRTSLLRSGPPMLLSIGMGLLAFYIACFSVIFQLKIIRVGGLRLVLPLMFGSLMIYYACVSHKIAELIIAGIPVSLCIAVDSLVLLSLYWHGRDVSQGDSIILTPRSTLTMEMR